MKIGVDYDPPTLYNHNKGEFEKNVQNPPQILILIILATSPSPSVSGTENWDKSVPLTFFKSHWCQCH